MFGEDGGVKKSAESSEALIGDCCDDNVSFFDDPPIWEDEGITAPSLSFGKSWNSEG